MADFVVRHDDATWTAIDAMEVEGDPVVTATAACLGIDHRFVPRRENERGFQLRNTKDMLRYARYRTPLNNSVRLLAALEENCR